MELKDAKCPNCGGQLKLDPNLEKGICRYCNTEILVSEAIHRYKVEVDGIATIKSSMVRASNQLADGDYDGAMKTFKHIIEIDPENSEAYYEMFRCSVDIAAYYKNKNAGMQRTIPQYYEDLSEAVQKYGRRAVQYAEEPERSQYASEVNHIVDDIQAYANNQSNSSKGGCYVATAVYGSYDCPEVWTLRRFRDNTLAKTWHGRLFIKVYYTVSPAVVRLFGNTGWFKKIGREKLDTMVERLQNEGVESTPYEDKKW